MILTLRGGGGTDFEIATRYADLPAASGTGRFYYVRLSTTVLGVSVPGRTQGFYYDDPQSSPNVWTKVNIQTAKTVFFDNTAAGLPTAPADAQDAITALANRNPLGSMDLSTYYGSGWFTGTNLAAFTYASFANWEASVAPDITPIHRTHYTLAQASSTGDCVLQLNPDAASTCSYEELKTGIRHVGHSYTIRADIISAPGESIAVKGVSTGAGALISNIRIVQNASGHAHRASVQFTYRPTAVGQLTLPITLTLSAGHSLDFCVQWCEVQGAATTLIEDSLFHEQIELEKIAPLADNITFDDDNWDKYNDRTCLLDTSDLTDKTITLSDSLPDGWHARFLVDSDEAQHWTVTSPTVLHGAGMTFNSGKSTSLRRGDSLTIRKAASKFWIGEEHRKSIAARIVSGSSYPGVANSARLLVKLCSLKSYLTTDYSSAGIRFWGSGDYDTGEHGELEAIFRVRRRGATTGVFVDGIQVIAPTATDNGGFRGWTAFYNSTTGEIDIYVSFNNPRFVHYGCRLIDSDGMDFFAAMQVDQTINVLTPPAGFVRADNVSTNAWQSLRT